MTNFTDNPLERLMRQKPLPGKRRDKADIESYSDATPEQSALSTLDDIPVLVDKIQFLLPGSRCVNHPDMP